MTYFAHTGPDGSLEDGQTIEDHLRGVANLCASFAQELGYEHWGAALGLLHDAGKATDEFQARLKGAAIHVDHSTAGAQLCCQSYDMRDSRAEIAARLMALAIAGHHGGMPNVKGKGKRPTLDLRLQKSIAPIAPVIADMLQDGELRIPTFDELEALPPLRDQRILAMDASAIGACNSYAIQLLGRMLFSCLVDADYLDTERWYSPEAARMRERSRASLPELLDRLNKHMESLSTRATDSPVNRARTAILNDCRAAANAPTGLYTLSVETGGGKTLSSLAFSLEHAIRTGKKRVIYAIPFVSICEQTADVFRGIFGQENVLEHHSSRRVTDEGENASETSQSERLVAQNWDAPIIVTTNVQLFESLYSNRPGRCRKLHNIANSVIVLDEAQTLPDKLLLPTLAAIEALTIDFNTSVVLCTATQPALDTLWPFQSKPREIVVHRDHFDEAFGRRVEFTKVETIALDALADTMASRWQALCIVGTKPKARNLFDSLLACARRTACDDQYEDARSLGIFHLSTNMVSEHRAQVIEEIRRRLREGERCLVVSTQLIEAGVDVDFPEVWRELAGIDSLMQAAGRCNREGNLRDEFGRPMAGVVHVFKLEEDAETGTSSTVRSWLGAMKAIADDLIERHGGIVSSDLVKSFFERRYHLADGRDESRAQALDAKGILQRIDDSLAYKFSTLEYESYAEDYRIIEDDGEAIYVAWDAEGRRLIKRARKLSTTNEAGTLFIPLQRYAVNVYPHVYHELAQAGAIEEVGPYHMLVDEACLTRYSDDTGLLSPQEEELNSLVI